MSNETVKLVASQEQQQAVLLDALKDNSAWLQTLATAMKGLAEQYTNPPSPLVTIDLAKQFIDQSVQGSTELIRVFALPNDISTIDLKLIVNHETDYYYVSYALNDEWQKAQNYQFQTVAWNLLAPNYFFDNNAEIGYFGEVVQSSNRYIAIKLTPLSNNATPAWDVLIAGSATTRK